MTELLATTARDALLEISRVQVDGRIPSIAAGVVRGGELVWSTGRGTLVRREHDQRPDSDTQYKIGSVTKTMTAALVLLARERGQLALADPISRFLPDGPFAEATVRSLLTHASGISAEPAGSWWERSDGVDLAELTRVHASHEPVLEPGAQVHYSNLGYGLLGGVVEAIWGQSWWDVLHSEVLAPLGMERTTYQWQQPAAEGFAVDALTGEALAELLPDTGAMAPAGQLWSTVADLATWLTALVDAERSILTEATLRDLATPQVGVPDDVTGLCWGLGVSVSHTDGRRLVGHGGSMPGFSCGVVADTTSKVGAIVLTNGAYGLGNATGRLLQLVLDREPALPQEWRPTSEPVPQATREILGTWHWGHAPSLARWDGERLRLAPVSGPGRVMSFVPHDDGTWLGASGYLTGEVLRVRRRSDGSVSHLECATFIWTRQPYDPRAPIPGGVAQPERR